MITTELVSDEGHGGDISDETMIMMMFSQSLYRSPPPLIKTTVPETHINVVDGLRVITPGWRDGFPRCSRDGSSEFKVLLKRLLITPGLGDIIRTRL